MWQILALLPPSFPTSTPPYLHPSKRSWTKRPPVCSFLSGFPKCFLSRSFHCSMAHIVATRPLIEDGLSGLRDEHTVTVCDPPDGSTRSVDELIALTDGADVLLSMLADPVTERLFEARPGLQLVSQYAVGVDNIDLEAAEAHDVVVTHTPGVLTDATADMTWALLLAVARHVPAADQYVRDGRFERWETTLLLGTELSGKTMGIVGLGRIGAAVARRALGFGMDVVYHNRHRANRPRSPLPSSSRTSPPRSPTASGQG